MKKHELWCNFLTHYQTTKFLDVTKLKAFADENFNAAKMTISLFDRVENTGKKRKGAFSLFSTVFFKVFF